VKTPTRALAVLAAAGAVASLSACSTAQPITRPKVEASLTPAFTNLYLKQQAELGHTAVTAATVRPSSACDRGGPQVADTGAGSDWICMVTFTDDTGTQQVGKFELQVHANACYTVSGPASLLGSFTITDTTGEDVPNPVNAFDVCFDPDATAPAA
jgi:hypothetical protein